MKRRYKRDYVILESKDSSFRLKEKTSPKAFAKIEMKEDKANLMLYVENVKYIKQGYRVVIIEDDLNVKDIGRVLVNENGKGEFKISFNEENLDIKAIALTHDKKIPLIGFRGRKLQDYEDIIFAKENNIKDDTIENKVKFQMKEEKIEDNIHKLEIDNDLSKENNIKDNLSNPNLEIDEEDVEIKDEDIKQELSREENEEVIILDIDEKKEKKKKEKKEEDCSREEKREEINKEKLEEEDILRKYTEEKIYFVPRKLKKILNKYKEIKPFMEDIEDTRWWKIDISPMSICAYIMPYLGYINYINCTLYSDITSLSYKYRHYIFGIKYSEEGKRKYYIYGIPGRKNEQPDEGNTGFCHFIPCDNKYKTYGYWVCFIDCKSRLIAMAEE
ncbi:hypothetical protein [Tepidibacter formicigenes]|uniref:Uncharacterized protein n=1 Tax=Tepidibacter formicigenes DSM 15518 TaxID=1123349 RepID=A0A1M6NR95_9FIRM|nr:hypothetical protein [Tepidibacter formicigenes]SHJ98261.1 hypothetical protein SAMN02744037_01337 [Tepidibacter formicigenes DSM 15518]